MALWHTGIMTETDIDQTKVTEWKPMTHKERFKELEQQVSEQTDAYVELMDDVMRSGNDITQDELKTMATGILKALSYIEMTLHALNHKE